MTAIIEAKTSILEYVESNESYYDLYQAYLPDLATLTRVAIARPSAHVIIPSRYSCSDCVRNMPRMARIADYLPGWTWDVYSHDDYRDRNDLLGVTNIPTFIVLDSQTGRELGRIVENPVSRSLEADLLQIVTAAR